MSGGGGVGGVGGRKGGWEELIDGLKGGREADDCVGKLGISWRNVDSVETGLEIRPLMQSWKLVLSP